MKTARDELGADFWLLRSKSSAKVDDLLGIKSSDDKFAEEDTSQDSEKKVELTLLKFRYM